jgi:ADP-ribosylglycohydrolase/protein-tyrosine phosphatase
MVRTSHTHPLEIPLLDVPRCSGRIGVTFCPGKKGASVHGARWNRDLAADLAAIAATGATALVTLLEPHEFTMLNVDALPAELAKLGLEWHHLPIRDVHVPDASFETRWVYAGARIRERLRNGETVVVHCRGGLGRAGTVAARLLVEFGLPPRVAMHRVREARPGAIETPDQGGYVGRWQRLERDRDRAAARRLAVLLGGALGDAFGYRVEFERWERIRRAHGPDGIRFAQAGGPLVISDDTQMTMFTLEGLRRARAANAEPLDEIRRAYLDWHDTQRGGAPGEISGSLATSPVPRVRRAPGTTCLSALAAGGHGSVERPINDRKGCGGVMRVAPVGFEAGDDAALFALGAHSAALTHGHPDGYLPSGAMAVLVRQALGGADLATAAERARAQLATWDGHAPTTAAIDAALELAGTRLAPPEIVGSLDQGWVGEEALAVGLWAASTGRDFADVLELAANHDGDSDSTASLAGQLYAAVHGLEAIPAEAVYRMDALAPLLEVAGRETDLSTGSCLLGS